MRYAFDAQLLMEAEKTGIGYVADCLLREICRQDKEDELQLNYYSLRKPAVPESLREYMKMGFRLRCGKGSYTAYKAAWNIIPVPYSHFFGNDADVTMFFNYYISPGVKGRKVTMFHDMGYKAFPETVRFRTKNMLDLNMGKACKWADAIFCVSEFTRDEVLKYLDVDPKKLVVMPEGIRSDRFHTGYDKADIASTKGRYRLPDDYLLYLGTLEPRKNIVRMIEAYALLKTRHRTIPPLVLAGRKGWMYSDIFQRITELNIESDVICTGYVPDEDVPLILSGAMGFVFASLYEGFGLPPLEAMACGVPVLTTNGNSLKEVVGDAAILVEPFSIEDISEGMEKLICDSELRADLSKRGVERAGMYNWARSAEIVLDTFRSLT